MTTQYAVLIGLPNGLALDAGKLFTLADPDTVVTGNTFSFLNRTNANTQYVVSIVRATALPAGDYTFIAYIGSSPKVEIALTFLGTDGETATETARLAELDSTALDPVLEAIADINAGGLTPEQAAQINAIEAAVTEVPVTVNNFGQFDNSGALLLKRGHTATIIFISTTSNLVPDMSSATTKVFFGIYDTARRRWLQLEGTKVVNTGLQSISFTIPADKAAAMITGVHLFDAVVVYGYTAASGDTPASYTSLRPFASGNVRVVELSLDLTDL